MRVICIYRDNEEYTRTVTDWLEDFRRQTGREIETMDPDQNVSFCETSDIVEYPTVIVLDNNGSVLASWRGAMMPLKNEVLYYII